MVLQQQPDLTVDAATQGEVASESSNDLAVEPVERVRKDVSREAVLSRAARLERLQRLVLEVRVLALEDELERAAWRREQLIERYEQVIDQRETADGEVETPTFSWLSWG